MSAACIRATSRRRFLHLFRPALVTSSLRFGPPASTFSSLSRSFHLSSDEVVRRCLDAFAECDPMRKAEKALSLQLILEGSASVREGEGEEKEGEGKQGRFNLSGKVRDEKGIVSMLKAESGNNMFKSDLFPADLTSSSPSLLSSLPSQPGRPSYLNFVLPHQLAVESARMEEERRKRKGLKLGRAKVVPSISATILHSLAHIELNALDLYLDTALRAKASTSVTFPLSFYSDIIGVALDEAKHLRWVLLRLESIGYTYGDLPVHLLLWRLAQDTSADLAGRVATVPLVQEARGLDAGPTLEKKLRSAGDAVSAEVVRAIVGEEEGHVSVGVRWFSYLHKMGVARCGGVGGDENSEISGGREGDGKAEAGVDEAFQWYVRKYCRVPLPKPFNELARARAGMPRQWYEPLGEE
uniref:Uncharacterized protein n=1 Tax=Palpitomonas bilix TaxID=652834 RepID=A0A7S3GEJ4_9EUKA|mmetsp:Transcript_4614/g.9564  ORF Transcript_4614/g.9564 Transcript_4614/m.9564 type:complete len:412 (+) Transcript_4614:261-1496(+)